MQLTTTQSSSPNVVASFNLTSVTSNNTENVSIADCDLAFQDVESLVVCQGQSCRVNAMRATVTDQSKIPISFGNAFNIFPLATIGAVDTTADFTPFTWANLSSLQPDVFSRNLGLAYNSFWQSTYAEQFLTGNLTSNISFYDADVSFNTSQAQITRFDGDQYVCNRVFVGLLFVISCLLLIEAVSSILLKKLTFTPDILGYLSSCTRDNPYAKVGQALHLDGLQRTRALQSVRVAIGDVNISSDIGHIALSTTVEAQSLRKDRLYN
ncbi:hypothetical protein LSUB1_G008235 [Lachnellula subtilissima]|uniref:Uncharacterized protein n=1 Tax=Lachnellula subtilissima TaxID=602034 RepID=A0A8H8RKU2_9HELO|nr:hypothetical protein LSUB1_G008235 [Lachnellula subtilissima]